MTGARLYDGVNPTHLRVPGLYEHVTCMWHLVPEREKAVHAAVDRLARDWRRSIRFWVHVYSSQVRPRMLITGEL